MQCKARWPEVMPDRFFNTLFVISPQGEIVHRAAKNHLWCRERSCTPHDIYDRWVELFGDGIEAFYPVLRTDDIGNLGTICCSDGEYPEAVRALAFGGAEVVYRPSEAVPMTQAGEPGGTWLLQNRAHAHFNSLYVVAPNVGPVYVHPQMEHPYDIGGGNSHIVDYQGAVIGHTVSGANSFVAGIVDIEALRQFRVMNLNSNWMKDLRTELFREDVRRSPSTRRTSGSSRIRCSTRRSTRSTAATSSGSSSAGRSRRPRTPSPAAASCRRAAIRPTPTGRTSSSSGRTNDVALGAPRARASHVAELLDRARPREQIALAEVAADLAQPGVLLGPLDALGDGRHARGCARA